MPAYTLLVIGPPAANADQLARLCKLVLERFVGEELVEFSCDDVRGPVLFDVRWIDPDMRRQSRKEVARLHLWLCHVSWARTWYWEPPRSFTIVVQDESYWIKPLSLIHI